MTIMSLQQNSIAEKENEEEKMTVFNNIDNANEEEMTVSNEIDDIIGFLTDNKTIVFKSQQRGEADPTNKEKAEIAYNIYQKSKLNFLMRFGKYLKYQHLKHFEKYTRDTEPDSCEIDIILKDCFRSESKSHKIDVRNRRYEALKHLVKKDKYFSEIEMMKRNPLLYEQLVGQYMTEEEKRERDKYEMDQNVTFVKILMEGIERDNAEAARKNEEEREVHELEDYENEESSSGDEEDKKFADPKPSTSMWGEFEEGKTTRRRIKPSRKKFNAVTAQERLVLREEFISTMYENFLEGKDEDFDYETVDNDTSYDNMEEMEHDDEDKYFAEDDLEEIREDNDGPQSSEDELDIYMNALNQHPAVSQLAKDINSTL